MCWRQCVQLHGDRVRHPQGPGQDGQRPQKTAHPAGHSGGDFLAVGLLLKMVGVDWLNFAPSGDHLWQADYIGNYLVDIIMIPTFFGAVAFLPGTETVSADMHANAVAEGKDRQGKNRSGRIYPGPD
jgi:hypothetical protein